jgi:hypothetical protein
MTQTVNVQIVSYSNELRLTWWEFCSNLEEDRWIFEISFLDYQFSYLMIWFGLWLLYFLVIICSKLNFIILSYILEASFMISFDQLMIPKSARRWNAHIINNRYDFERARCFGQLYSRISDLKSVIQSKDSRNSESAIFDRRSPSSWDIVERNRPGASKSYALTSWCNIVLIHQSDNSVLASGIEWNETALWYWCISLLGNSMDDLSLSTSLSDHGQQVIGTKMLW